MKFAHLCLVVFADFYPKERTFPLKILTGKEKIISFWGGQKAHHLPLIFLAESGDGPISDIRLVEIVELFFFQF